MNLRLFLIKIGLLLPILVVSGQPPVGAFELKPGTPGDRIELEISHMYTDFELVGYDGEIILIEMYKGMLDSKVAHPPVRFVQDDNKISITHSNSWTKGYAMKLWVPFQTSASVDASYASSIKVSDLRGEIKVKSHAADVELDAIEGNVDINTFEGDITVINLLGSPLLHTNDGDIRIAFKELPDAYPNILVSMYGDIIMELQPDANISFRLKMERNFDKIKSDFMLQPIQASDFPMGKDESFNYYRTINEGGVPIFIWTFRGNVTISSQVN